MQYLQFLCDLFFLAAKIVVLYIQVLYLVTAYTDIREILKKLAIWSLNNPLFLLLLLLRINSLFSLKIVQYYTCMKAIFAGVTELYLKHHPSSRLTFCGRKHESSPPPVKPGVLPAGPDRSARKILAFMNMVENPIHVFCFERQQIYLQGHSHGHLPIITQRWLCWSRHFHSMDQNNFQFGYQSNFHFFFVTTSSWRVFDLLHKDSKATLCLHTANMRRCLSCLHPLWASLKASTSVLHEANKHGAHSACAGTFISRARLGHLLLGTFPMEIPHMLAKQCLEKFL